jgi:RNA polymerase sigma-70 factor (ECF subfamily)
MPAEDVYHDLLWQELRSVLDQELQTLPAKYQAPLVLCYLEGLSNEEAARRLGWPSGSISYRLAKGREMLRQRLAGREQMFSADAFAAVLSTQAAAAELPDALLQATLAAALAAAVPPAVVGGNFIRKAFRALSLDNRSTVVLVLMLLLSLGLATSVVARGFIDSGGQSNSGKTAVSPTSRPCH